MCYISAQERCTHTYTRQDLLWMRETATHYKALKNLDVLTVCNIRQNKLERKKNRRCKRGGNVQKRKYLEKCQTKGVNTNNLINIKSVPCIDHKFPVNIFTVNARSLLNKSIDIRNFICENKCSFGIITETWLNDESNWHLCDLNTNGFKLDPIHRRKSKGGGLALVYNDSCSVQRLKWPRIKCMELGLWKVIQCNIATTVLGIYRPPYTNKNKVTDNQFVDEFLEVLADILPRHDNLVILGDLNVHWNNFDNPTINSLENSLTAIGLKQHVQEYTHKDGNILDVIITSDNIKYEHKYSVKDFLSDHRYVIFETTRLKQGVQHQKKAYRNTKDVPDSTWKEKLSAIELCDSENVNSLSESFENALEKILDEVAPIQEKIIRSRTPKAWFSKEIYASRSAYRKCFKIWKKTRRNTDWIAVKNARNEYCKKLKLAKRAFFTKKVLESKGDTKKLYHTINGLIKRENENPLPANRSSQDLAQHFSDFFSQKVAKIASHLQNYPNYKPPSRDVPQLSSFNQETLESVSKIITKLGNKQCELDKFPVHILNNNKEASVPNITKLVNKSLTSGQFPDHWKQALVKPLIKKPSLGPVDTNYRPVSNLIYLGKVIERAALQQIVQHCERNGLLPKFQSAYRKGFSCETMLIKLADLILNHMETGRISAVVLMDLSAAFDTVNHTILLETFEKFYGITGEVLSWIKSFLSGRSFRVNVNTKMSEEKQLYLSVPQGGCSSAFFFIMYAATLFYVIPEGINLFGFADDHALQSSFLATSRSDEENTIHLLESTLLTVQEWMNKTKLKMNPDKTEFMYFGSRQHLQKCSSDCIDVCGDDIKKSESVRYLGGYLDKNLNSQDHV